MTRCVLGWSILAGRVVFLVGLGHQISGQMKLWADLFFVLFWSARLGQIRMV